MMFIPWSRVRERFHGKRVAIVGGGPSVLDNEPGRVDSFDVVVRINNYRLGDAQGRRCDVFYSFFGGSIKKTPEELRRDGVTLCMCKCPDDKPIESEWHKRNDKQNGIDFRYIYNSRRGWWFCDTFVPSVEHFMRGFNLLGRHIPTTGFSAILDVLSCGPAITYITGFDGFRSGLHNVSHKWRPGDPADPIGHRPELEAQWIADHAHEHLLMLDPVLSRIVNEKRMVAA